MPGAYSTREAASACLNSAHDKVRNAVGLCKFVFCLPQPFYYLPQQINSWHLGAEENLVLEGAQVWDLQHLYFWLLLLYPEPQVLLYSHLVVSSLRDYSRLFLICLLTQITT